jgi:hypothetical protein
MSSDPDVLRELVDQKAEDLKRDLQAIGDRVAQPKDAALQKIATARKFYSPVKTFVQSHPTVASVVAFGVGLAFGYVL